ncbi:Mig-related protein [Trichomonas vaginalis G3]|uniref:Mig-related protein n=1 Tax=Trichomonas vaginalis (strain ATCC PRA-98 / G3) TaxID=412133 RepID=A2FUL7_TRIV3|nr:protein ubiquitination [Trichomonas vaginalis G3]EAX91397.1 Mig-related protein [Trichomonas vaginalis G3]KAI5545613.1 protein ubiquitination [Trichomonas vaginalis G3]|eukprot:XP_001304327.1 Mig-related protein [Trichomonas vaginalis G3]
MTASSVDGGNLSNINSYSNNDDFYTIIQPNPWLKADLKGYKLKPKSYILQSRCLSNSDFLRSWKLEGIKEDGTTIVLENNNYKFTQREIKEFPLQTNDYFVAFRITQTGKNSYGNERLMINIFDFKGELIKI